MGVRLCEGGDLPQQPWGQAADEYEFDRYASTRRERRDLAGRRGDPGMGPKGFLHGIVGWKAPAKRYVPSPPR